MEKEKIISLLGRVRSKKISIDRAVERLRHMPYEDLGFAKVDHHRHLRTGFPEVVFCQGKTDSQIIAIFRSLAKQSKTVLLTRCEERTFRKIKRFEAKAAYNAQARLVTFARGKKCVGGLVSVVCAGTSDIPVAEEAAATAEAFGCAVERNYDVGVAGVHRLLDCFRRIGASRCIIAVAGMEGALASVIGGLARCPVIAVPTSVGYGASFKGIAPLLTMLNSCAPGVSVVNIDNGFGAGYCAAMINAHERVPALPLAPGIVHGTASTAPVEGVSVKRVKLAGRGKFTRVLSREETAGMKSGFVRLKAGESIGEHSTGEREESIIVLSGKADVFIKGKRAFACGEKTLAYIPPGTVHDIRNSGTMGLEYVYLVAPADRETYGNDRTV